MIFSNIHYLFCNNYYSHIKFSKFANFNSKGTYKQKKYIFLKECMYINNKNKFSSNINFFTALVKYMKKEISAKTPRTNLKH